MAWLGKVSLGGFPDLAGAVTKLSESVKNIEKNFDSALGLEEKSSDDEASGSWASASDTVGLFEPVMSFMGHKGDGSASQFSDKTESSKHAPVSQEHKQIGTKDSEEHKKISIQESEEHKETPTEESEEHKNVQAEGYEERKKIPTEESPVRATETTAFSETKTEDSERRRQDVDAPEKEPNDDKEESKSSHLRPTTDLARAATKVADSVPKVEQRYGSDGVLNDEPPQIEETSKRSSDGETSVMNSNIYVHDANSLQRSHEENEAADAQIVDEASPRHSDKLNAHAITKRESSAASPADTLIDGHANDMSDSVILNSTCSTQPQAEASDDGSLPHVKASNLTNYTQPLAEDSKIVSLDADLSSKAMEMRVEGIDYQSSEKKLSTNTTEKESDSMDSFLEVEKMKQEMKMMEAALQGAARQAQVKADEIARLMNDNEQLKTIIEDLKRKPTEAEIDALREEYHQRLASIERKVYALTRERDALRREQNKKSDAAALLKEKDEIISQVMAEGEELSKKQAAKEATIRKLRAQIREFEEEKQRLYAKLQAEETKVESIKRDKAATEKLLQETIERNQAEIAAQKEFYTNALNAAKEAEALAEARVNSEAKIELESRLKESSEREVLLVQTLEELRQTLSRTEQQAVFREEMLRRDIDDLQKRYQASEMRYNEVVTQVPESTRPLLRQIEAIQDTAARRAEAWAGVEKALNSRLQEAEAKAAAAEEKERALNERLSQSISRITVLETQITCLRTEQTQLSRSLEKERQRATKSGQDYLAAMEEATTQEGRAKQIEDEIKELRIKHKKELQEEATHRELLEKELERVKSAKAELEKSRSHDNHLINQSPISSLPIPKLSSAGSLNSIEDNPFLKASLDSSDNFFSERRMSGETTVSQYFLKTMTQSAFEAALRQKDGELASYMSRLASLESIRDSLAEELVKMTEECEKLRAEAAGLSGLRAELEALRQRHSAALELMGERDEELEELRADIVDLKEMYREQVDLLVDRIQRLSASTGMA